MGYIETHPTNQGLPYSHPIRGAEVVQYQIPYSDIRTVFWYEVYITIGIKIKIMIVCTSSEFLLV